MRTSFLITVVGILSIAMSNLVYADTNTLETPTLKSDVETNLTLFRKTGNPDYLTNAYALTLKTITSKGLLFPRQGSQNYFPTNSAELIKFRLILLQEMWMARNHDYDLNKYHYSRSIAFVPRTDDPDGKKYEMALKQNERNKKEFDREFILERGLEKVLLTYNGLFTGKENLRFIEMR